MLPAFEVTEAEQNLIEILREQTNPGDTFRLVIAREDGAWEIEWSSRNIRGPLSGRGVGRTFDESWENVSPSWA